MKSSRARRMLVLAVAMMAGLLAGCKKDPNVLKQKYFESGARYFAKERYREAIIQYANATRIDSKYAEAHYGLAQCYLKLGVWEGAYNELMQTVELKPDDAKAQVSLGNLLLAARQFDKAKERAALVLQKDAKNIDAHILLANSYAALNNMEASIQEMEGAIQLDPGQPQVYMNLAILQTNAKQLDQAEQSYKKALQLDSKSVPALLALGNFYIPQRRWSDAEQQFRHAMELEPKNPLPRAALARLYLFQGQKSLAEQALVDAKKAIGDRPEGYRMLGDYYFVSGDADKALAEYGSLYHEHPKDETVKHNYLQLLIMRGRLDEAARINDATLKDKPKDAYGLLFKGQIMKGQGKINEAIQAFQAVVKNEPDSPVAHYYLGTAFAQSGDLARAENEWREAARLRPSLVEAQRALASAALRKGDTDLLQQSGEALINARPASPEGYVFRAIARGSREGVADEAGAEADFQKAMELAPDMPLVYIRMAGWRLRKKRYGDAEKLYEKALDLDPKAAEAVEGLAEIYNAQKQPSKALARINSQIAKVPNNSAYYFLLANLLFSSKDLDKAEPAAREAVDLDKNNIEALLLLGEIQVARGAVDRAIQTSQASVQSNPHDVRGYVMLARLEESRGNWQKAQEYYQKALQVEPGYPPAANNLAYLMLEHGLNTDVALSLAQTARRGLPDSAQAADTLGWAYYRKGAYRSAVDLLEEAAKKAPKDATVFYHLGLSYQKLNAPDRAKAALQRALQLEPHYPQTDEIRGVLAQLNHR